MFNLADSAINSQVFYAKGASDFQIWQKPPGCKMVQILCLGSGSGGGGGTVGTASTARKGGGGGASGAISQGNFLAFTLPDILYLQVAQGGLPGAGGASPTAGGNGALSYVAVRPDITTTNSILVSGAAAATGGLAGASGTGGTASTVYVGSTLTNLGLATSNAGQNGATGVISVPGASITIANIMSGGASGGNTSTGASFAGGDITGSGFINTIPGGALGAGATAGGAGSDGYTGSFLLNLGKRDPLFFTGGSGGGASVSGQGGVGGAGAYGCGGGGGGAGFTGLAGAGGRGGDGLIIIVCS